jgi:hypothetical protein
VGEGDFAAGTCAVSSFLSSPAQATWHKCPGHCSWRPLSEEHVFLEHVASVNTERAPRAALECRAAKRRGGRPRAG